jgi:hypothetical protein
LADEGFEAVGLGGESLGQWPRDDDPRFGLNAGEQQPKLRRNTTTCSRTV